MKMRMDNQASICQMESERSSFRAKHIDMNINFTKDCSKGHYKTIICAHRSDSGRFPHKSLQRCQTAHTDGTMIADTRGSHESGQRSR